MKLIRDKYVHIIHPDRLEYAPSSVLKESLLIEKIQEELGELKESEYTDCNEFADVIEVLYALAKTKGISEKEINIAREFKNDKRGSFDDGLILKDG